MSWLARIEQTCASFIERTFAKTFPSDLEPAQIARKLVATMEAKTARSDGQMSAPGRYDVRVGPQDFVRLESHRPYLEREWAQMLREIAGQVGIVFTDGEPSVRLSVQNGIPMGTVEVAPFDDGEETRSTSKRPLALQLRMVEGVPEYGTYPLQKLTRIGRSEECDVMLVDPAVSRHHAIIELEDGVATVHDLNSTNGTLVNGVKVESRRLEPDDVIAIGKTSLRLEAVGG